MSDLIDRQAAIDAYGDWYVEEGTADGFIGTVKQLLEGFPSAQLGTNLAEVGRDLISRQAAIDALDRIFDRCEEIEAHLPEGDPDRTGYKMYPDYMTVWKYLHQLPSAQPDIIRCKDCKHWMPYEWMFSEVWQSQNIDDYPEDEIGCNISDMSMKANDFCSRGERRTDG